MTLPPGLSAKTLWPTTFYTRPWEEHDAEAGGIIEHLYRLKAATPARIASGIAPGAKAGGLYESGFDLFAEDHAGLSKFKAFAGQTLRAVACHVNGNRTDPTRLRVTVPDSWFHITNDGGFHDAHHHGGCSWCGIYYLQIGDSGLRADGGAPNGGNRFYSPLRAGGSYNDFGNRYLEFNTVDPPPQDGLLLLFPSYLMHSGLPYRGEKDRIVISFNAQITAS
ncbi:MAG TPA: putative 2OG-Fe(II) oxygenase [Fimbriiglobus sp.]|jgi:uncharacterized protein (TIGR02466 family)